MVKCRIFHCMEMLLGGRRRANEVVQTAQHHRAYTSFRPTFSRAVQNHFESCSFLVLSARNHIYFPVFLRCFAREMRYPAPGTSILHPILHLILHPKLPVNTGSLGCECRKCSFFSKTFFKEERYNGPGVAKHRTSVGKSTDVLHQKYGCLPQRSPMFLAPATLRMP